MLKEEKKIELIAERLAELKSYIKMNTKVNLNNICIISEDFFCKLLNSIFDYKLVNANILENNFGAIDLIDEENKIVIQVTVDNSAEKIQKTINKFQNKFDSSYIIKFIIISDSKRYNKNFSISSGYSFDKKNDIIFIEDFIQLSRKDIDGVYNIIENEFYVENLKRTYEWFKNNNKNNIEDLGCRYNKEIDITTETYKKLEDFLINEKNLTTLLLKIKEFIYSLNEFEDELVEKKKIDILKATYSQFIKEMKIINIDEIYFAIKDINIDINKKKDIVIKNEEKDEYSKKNKIYSLIKQCELCSEKIELITKKALIIKGNMGTGKSHIIASYIENVKLANEEEAILILGQHLNDSKLFKLQIKDVLEISEDFEKFIKELNAKGKEKNIFIPLFIDAINESLYNANWKEELNGLINIVKEYKYVKIVITLRTDYTQKCLPEKIEEEYVEIIEHHGFQDEENIYSIISEIFHYYGVPIPLFPMINDEYTNPLFIISLCKWVRDYHIDILIQDYTSFMNIFEKYIFMINKRLAKEFKFNEDNFLLDNAINKIVEYMVQNNKLYITQDEFFNIEKDLLKNYEITPINFLDKLKSEGLIFKSIYSKDEIIYFSYEQYVSILKANLLFEKIKNIESINFDELKKLLLETTDFDILKNIFILLGNKYKIEIYDIFDNNEEVKNEAYIIQAYISSLLWRKKDSFDKNSKFIKFIEKVSNKYEWILSEYKNLFYYCSTIIDSPFNIYYYNEKLKNMSLSERDFEFTIRLDENISTRMALYCLNADMREFKKENRIMLAIILSWFLATPNRYIRDISTKALVNLLTNNIETMVELINNFKEINDLYILERIYGSCYGALLRSDECQNIESLLKVVYENVFNSEEVIPNIIIRYYAKNIILYAKNKVKKIEFDIEKIYPPYNSKWYTNIPNNKEIKKYIIDYKEINKENRYLYAQNTIIESMLTEDAKDIGMYGDFGRYYFGFYISKWKQNFKSEQILSNIAIKRVFDFGYDVKKFGRYDIWQKEKEGYDRHGHKYERIGKKYQWIAMYEILAKLQDNYKYLKTIERDSEKDEIYYNWKGEKEDFSNATYKEQIYEECNINILNIDVTNLIKISKKEKEDLKIDISEKWLNEDISDIKSIIEKEDFISLSALKRVERKTLELYERYGILGDFKYDSEMTIIYQAYLYRNKLILDDEEKEGMFRGEERDTDLLMLEYPWKYEIKGNLNDCKDNYYITNNDYTYNSEYDMTSNKYSSISQPSQYLVNLLQLKQGSNGYWYDNNKKIICYDTILENGKNEFIIKKDILNDMLHKNKLKIVWMGYIEKKYKDNIREYRFRIDRKENGEYKLTEKWKEEEWKY